jgi:hypothetical protein
MFAQQYLFYELSNVTPSYKKYASLIVVTPMWQHFLKTHLHKQMNVLNVS